MSKANSGVVRRGGGGGVEIGSKGSGGLREAEEEGWEAGFPRWRRPREIGKIFNKNSIKKRGTSRKGLVMGEKDSGERELQTSLSPPSNSYLHDL